MRLTAVADSRVLTTVGVLDGTTYRPLRDAIVKAALDEPRSVIVDVTKLTVREEPAWAVFTSARWQVAEWPDIPIGLVCAHENGRNALHRNGITRYVPVCATLESAVRELSADGLRRYRRTARAKLLAKRSSIHRSREMTAQWLTTWSRTDFIYTASAVATELVEVALTETDGDLLLRVETDGSTVSVAVQLIGNGWSGRRRSEKEQVSGLDLVAKMSRHWGRHATAAGNTIWAVVGPENRF
ncbi:sulfate transporter [Mycobacterium cookii]|nr:sulfate transporter [Mycobacterium cookii]